MDLSTNYLGLKLRNPLVPSSSPLSQDIDNIKRMEDYGAGAVVLHSIFEEQLKVDSCELHHHLTSHTESFSEASSFFPEAAEYHIGPDDYLAHIKKAKESVSMPIIASLNGSSMGGWIDFAKKIEKAGADALELNIYSIPTDMNKTSDDIEREYLDVILAVRSAVKLPIALKLTPFFSNLGYVAKRFSDAGANALVLFNRFYQPDIDLETLEVYSHVLLSTSQAIRLPMRWIAILYKRVHADLAANSGILGAEDIVKLLMVGANVTMMCSVLMRHGIQHLRVLEGDLRHWMEEHEYDSVQQMIGSVSQIHCDNPSAFERAQYIRALQGFGIS